jgi:hypothetical protein
LGLVPTAPARVPKPLSINNLAQTKETISGVSTTRTPPQEKETIGVQGTLGTTSFFDFADTFFAGACSFFEFADGINPRLSP